MTHPILTAAWVIDQALKSVADTNPTFMSTDDKAAALGELVRLESRVAELRLRILADAADVAATTAAHDPGAWLAHHAHLRLDDARADHALARALDRRYPTLAAALREGTATLAQARTVARSLDNLPAQVPCEVLTAAEETLVGHCARFGPKPLSVLGRRILHVVAPHIAEAAQARQLAALEAAAHRKTRLHLWRLGDGTTRLSGLLPDPVATRLATYLEAFTNPRKTTDPTPETHATATDPLTRLPYGRRLGEALCQFLECADPTRLPVHGGDATTVIVTIPLASLRAELGVADLLTTPFIPGEETTDTITAAQARRLACNARLIPAVLGGPSEILDLGRTQRLFSPAQHRAMLLRDHTCVAEGCTIPGTWCEAHHWQPWKHGGPTDLNAGALLCRHHHQRIHDPHYQPQRLPTGTVRFHPRR